MKNFSFYHRESGMLSSRHYSTTNSLEVELNTPADHVAIEGHYDHLSQRVDVATAQVVDHQPAQPSADHEWNPTAKRWVLSAAAAQRSTMRIEALAAIAELERKSLRALRESVVGVVDAGPRLREIEAQIQELRKKL